MEKKISITGMMCVKCAARVQKALEALDGVNEAKVSHEAGSALVTLDRPLPDELLRSAVENAGYTVNAIE